MEFLRFVLINLLVIEGLINIVRLGVQLSKVPCRAS